jgi:hypothetical protein
LFRTVLPIPPVASFNAASPPNSPIKRKKSIPIIPKTAPSISARKTATFVPPVTKVQPVYYPPIQGGSFVEKPPKQNPKLTPLNNSVDAWRDLNSEVKILIDTVSESNALKKKVNRNQEKRS